MVAGVEEIIVAECSWKLACEIWSIRDYFALSQLPWFWNIVVAGPEGPAYSPFGTLCRRVL